VKASLKLPTLETERLLLRSFVLSDAADVRRLAGNWAIADTTLNVPHPYEDGMAEAWISSHQRSFEAGELAAFAITLRANNELVGAIGLRVDRPFDRANLGYWIGEPFWGLGYCTEAATSIVEYGFGEMKLQRLHAEHLERNPASGRVLQKIGMSKEGIARQHTKKWGKYEDLVLYGLLRNEWLGRKS
jgi:ribosomal-protein-alanine N-acetyltransferase